jgi:uncharacterized zinc-type alcohol dehydrogenase-like protein
VTQGGHAEQMEDGLGQPRPRQLPRSAAVDGTLGAEVEVIAADQIDEAYERVVASDVRYRFVIGTGTL